MCVAPRGFGCSWETTDHTKASPTVTSTIERLLDYFTLLHFELDAPLPQCFTTCSPAQAKNDTAGDNEASKDFLWISGLVQHFTLVPRYLRTR